MEMNQKNIHIDEKYFEELEHNILLKVHHFEKQRKNRLDVLKKIILPFVVILFFITGSFIINSNYKNETINNDYSNYIAYNEVVENLNISDYELVVLVDEYNNTNDETTNSDNFNEIINYLSEDNSIDYEILKNIY